MNIKPESAFVQSPDTAQTLCVTIGNSQNQQGLGSLRPRHVQKNDFRTLEDVLATVEKKGSIRSATLWYGEALGQVFGNFFFSDLSLRPQASITHDEKLALGFSIFSRSTLASISSISSWGKRMFFFADLLLVLPLDTLLPQCSEFYVHPQYSKKCGNVSIDICAQKDLICAHSIKSGYYNVQRLRVLGTTTEASNQTVNRSNSYG
ncbi:hypothetical protein ACWWJF_05700 [Symbiopectobacterium sp. Eva_TO]